MVRLLLISFSLAALIAGCASPPIRTEGVTGPVTWHAIDLKLAKTTVDGIEGERYSLTLVLKEMNGTSITFTNMKRTVFQHHVSRSSPAEDVGRWRLQPNGELRFPLSFAWYCPGQPCLPVHGGPQWNILLTGTDDRGQPVRLAIDFVPVQTDYR